MPLRALVSGAGVAGPAIAWHLSRIGAQVKIVEKSKDFLDQGQNIDVAHSALTVIKRMGLYDELRAHNTNEKGTKFIDQNGKPYAPFPCRPGYVSPTSQFEILRGDLAKVLYSATSNDPNVSYHFSTTIKEVLTNDETSVKVKLDNGNEEEYDILVAADGQWSRLRKSIFADEDVKVINRGMYVGYFTIPRISTDDDWWNLYHALGSRVISLRPDSYGTIRAMIAHMPNESEMPRWDEAVRAGKEIQQELLRETFADAGWQSQRMLEGMVDANDFYFQNISQIKMSTWSKGRVVLLGDSAFCPSPLAGAGASLAILGSHVLAGELGKLEPGQHPSVAFKAYEDAFRSHVEETQDVPSFVPGIMHPGSYFKRWILQSVLTVLEKVVHLPWLAKKLAGTHGDDVEDYKIPNYAYFPQSVKT